MSTRPIQGIHHVTALATDPQANVDFYAGVLGLRLVKRTVNFDDPGTYHLYYGDERGHPGTILTFFPWPLARRGTRGTGQATVTAFSVPEGSLGWWAERLAAHGVAAETPVPRLDGEVLTLLDPDGLQLELVAHAGAVDVAPWAGGPVDEAHALRGFHSVTLSVADGEPTADLLAAMGYAAAGEDGRRHRFVAGGESGEARPGTAVDLLVDANGSRGHVAAGSVHHVAFRAVDDDDQLAWRGRVAGRGLHVTPVLDRNYFHSIYFREPGGVLFEVATDPPGFTVDEPVETLGEELKLPDWLEPHRERIEAALPPILVPVTGEVA